MLRTTAGCTALIVGLLLTLSAVAAPACEDTECPASSNPAKPLDIMKFMREQAASTRPSRPPNAKPRPVVAHARRPAAKAGAARPEAADLTSEAAKSFASQPGQKIPVLAGDELNAIDRAAAPAPAETVGAAPSVGPNVQMVDADEFNDIDRKAHDGLLAEAAKLRGEAEARGAPQAVASQPSAPRASTSWLQWIWSATAGTFAALAAAMHQLIG